MIENEPTVSVLMPVHAGVDPNHLEQALSSLDGQTRPPDQVVLVLDGPVTSIHEAVLARFPTATVLRLIHQRGAGPALAVGLTACFGTYVARADSDDINESNRLERQLAVITSDGGRSIDVCSAAMTEFETRPLRDVGVRGTVTEHFEFARAMVSRNPVHHPAVMFRRAAAECVGGYEELPFLEDYDLWARMLAAGSRFIGVEDPLVRYRVDGMHGRRTSRKLDRSELELQRRLVAYGLIDRRRMWLNLVLRGTYRRLPRPLLERAYSVLFRSRP